MVFLHAYLPYWKLERQLGSATNHPSMSTEIECPINGCSFTTGERSEAVAVALLNAHMVSHTSSPAPTPVKAKRGPKLDRPKVTCGISLEDWNMFTRRWTFFK